MFRFYVFQWIYLYLNSLRTIILASIQNMQRTGLNWPFLHRDLAIANVTCTCNKSQYMHESENVNIKLTKYANQLNKRPMGSIIKITVT